MTGTDMDLDQLVTALSDFDIPVLSETAQSLRAFRRNEEKVSARDISKVVLRDPLMTLKALRFAEDKRGARQSADITTVEHTVMMHGITNFLREFSEVRTLEDQFATSPAACEGALEVVSRSQHAAEFARAIAYRRHDVESDEVIVSALLHDVAELMLWFLAPESELEIQYLVENARGVRSAAAQRLVLGHTHLDLQLELCRAWNLPELLRRLMDDSHSDHPRVVNVVTAVAFARHLAHGWDDPALPDDYTSLGKLLGIEIPTAQRLIRNSSLAAARGWRDTGIRPVAYWLPMDHTDPRWREPRLRLPERPNVELLRRAVQVLQGAPRETERDVLIAWTLFALQFGLGLGRVLYASGTAVASRLDVLFCFDATELRHGQTEPFPVPVGGEDLVGRLLQKTQGVWVGGEMRERLMPLVRPEQRAWLADADFLAMSMHSKGDTRALVLASSAGLQGSLPKQLYAPFKTLCLALDQRLARDV
ncbi:MAG: HDOD domain-containing protein [Betaproteobacteria bacterium]|nr:HDOD domain-containing protein [Betaproteobacteria bacterium]